MWRARLNSWGIFELHDFALAFHNAFPQCQIFQMALNPFGFVEIFWFYMKILMENLSSQTPFQKGQKIIVLNNNNCWGCQAWPPLLNRSRCHENQNPAPYPRGYGKSSTWKLSTLPFASPKKMAIESLSQIVCEICEIELPSGYWVISITCPNFRISTATCELLHFFSN